MTTILNSSRTPKLLESSSLNISIRTELFNFFKLGRTASALVLFDTSSFEMKKFDDRSLEVTFALSYMVIFFAPERMIFFAISTPNYIKVNDNIYTPRIP